MTDEEYMQFALQQAREALELDEVPIGAIVVYQNEIIAQAHNLRETTNDPAGHAEFLALKQASEKLGAWRLTGCTVYVTLEPCIMCAGLMHQSRIDRCVYGASDEKAGSLGTLYAIHEDARLNHNFEATRGVCEQECADLLKQFFAEKRKSAKNSSLTPSHQKEEAE